MHKAVIDAGQINIEPEVLIEFESQGRLLIIGEKELVAQVLPSFSSLQVFCVITDDEMLDVESSVTMINQKLLSITGWLGAFTVDFSTDSLMVDLVLDMSPTPLMDLAVLPLGYFATKSRPEALSDAVAQLPDMVGIFDKPKFFNYKATTCAHSRRGVSGCSKCIEACPALAIATSGADTVSVNPNLCQGCGSCTVVCPTGAMTYALPPLDVSINRLRKMIRAFVGTLVTGGAHLLVCDETTGQPLVETCASELPDTLIPFSIEEIGALGMPFWLTALAFGVTKVTVLDAGSHSDHDWQELQKQISLCNIILSQIGHGEKRVEWLQTTSEEVLVSYAQHTLTPIDMPAAQFAGIDDKRRIINLALSHLYEFAPHKIDVLSLPDYAAFGEIEVDKEKCTLCMSCVAVCPAGAVLDGVDKPQLNFIEDLCVQCGLCDTACPEDAINLVSRYVFDREQARKKRLLHEEAIFHCISCQKPFATQKMIDTIMSKLSAHPMFQGEAKQRLMMCEDCRVTAMFKNPKGPM